jgi:hypothetical protein
MFSRIPIPQNILYIPENKFVKKVGVIKFFYFGSKKFFKNYYKDIYKDSQRKQEIQLIGSLKNTQMFSRISIPQNILYITENKFVKKDCII